MLGEIQPHGNETAWVVREQASMSLRHRRVLFFDGAFLM
jgi:hypothetical protein